MHFLYQYSLHFFLDTYHTVLYENANLKNISDHSQRLAVITKDLFQVYNITPMNKGCFGGGECNSHELYM